MLLNDVSNLHNNHNSNVVIVGDPISEVGAPRNKSCNTESQGTSMIDVADNFNNLMDDNSDCIYAKSSSTCHDDDDDEFESNCAAATVHNDRQNSTMNCCSNTEWSHQTFQTNLSNLDGVYPNPPIAAHVGNDSVSHNAVKQPNRCSWFWTKHPFQMIHQLVRKCSKPWKKWQSRSPWCSLCIRMHRRRLPNENILILSIIQLLCGFAAIILATVAFTKTIFLYQMGTGLWAGLLMLVTGFHGLVAARRPIMCMFVGLLVLCMIVSLAACVLICVSVAGAIEDGLMSKPAWSNDYVLPKSIVTLFGSNRTVDSITLKSLKFVGWPRQQSYSHLRMYQFVLHILLLVVGILEASVSLATSILCYRCVCSNSSNYRFQNPRSSRTNIVSFDAQTANHAVSILRSGVMNHFVGPGNLVLAIDSDPPATISCRPQIHHTLIPFLPADLNHALILTQAGSGCVALTAARAAANLIRPISLDQPSSEANAQLDCAVVTGSDETRHPSQPVRLFQRLRNRWQSKLHNSHRPRLLYTSFHIPEHNRPEQSTTPLSTMVYVMPSPIRDEPPMIFPPFPPSYNDHLGKFTWNKQHLPPSSPTSLSVSQSRRHARNLLSRSRRQMRHAALMNRRLSIRNRLSQLFSRQSRNSRSTSNDAGHLHSNRLAMTTSRRPIESTPISAGDRLIQPVLIIGDCPAIVNTEDPPPQYLDAEECPNYQ